LAQKYNNITCGSTFYGATCCGTSYILWSRLESMVVNHDNICVVDGSSLDKNLDFTMWCVNGIRFLGWYAFFGGCHSHNQ